MMTVDDILSPAREARAAARVARKFRPRVFMVEDGLHSEKSKRKLWFSFAVSLICWYFDLRSKMGCIRKSQKENSGFPLPFRSFAVTLTFGRRCASFGKVKKKTLVFLCRFAHLQYLCADF
ncbi:MAG: hypothetical protein II505_03730 [Bacteroidaceae bacterium]|nr:hypothetical protein [Bacteroidaceae bacterium]